MRKEYRSSNVRFCMDDENQRRTWEYLQSITRKEGSYGKILSDAFVQILDGNYAIEQGALQRNDTDGVIEQILSTQLSMLKRELLEKMESMYDNTQHATSQTGTNRADIENEAADVLETDMSDAMMTMALAMGDWVPEQTYLVPSASANDGRDYLTERAICHVFYGRYASHKAGKSLAEPSESDLCFDACVKTNKELLLTKVTKEPAELAILLELLMFEKVPNKTAFRALLEERR